MADARLRDAPCVYCKREVMPPFNVPHAEDCPSNTGIFPVLLRDVLCPAGCGCYIGLRCGDCGNELKEGDHYAHIVLTPGTGDGIEGAEVTKLVCLVCAARGAVSNSGDGS